ncbi:cell division protein ZipA [uncultured Shewanella sp.]|uniref:cell division protein ZipA n=1 Tax=uncultured Shewanella sp. TaxID=173975 RepID=UPI0026302D05|nr:cell division protein ZipA [uncultured Shewanella sp.]
MENLQLVLLILGAIAIIAVLVHGFWSIRKQQPKSLKEASNKGCFTDKSDRDAEGFDADGIGKVRVSKAKPLASSSPSVAQRGKNVPAGRGKKTAIKPTQDNKSLYQGAAPVVTRAHTDDADTSLMTGAERLSTSEPVASQHESLAEHQVDIEHLTEMPGISEPSSSEKRAAEQSMPANPLSRRHVDTVASQDALLFGHENEALVNEEQAQQEQHLPNQSQHCASPSTDEEPQAATAEHQSIHSQGEQDALAEPQDVLVLHVTAKEGDTFNGAELLPCLLTLNFKFGDMNIFHRHQDNAGKGQVLFSLANMVKPGIFNPDHMEQFTTQGVVLFMTLPCHGDALMNFSIMLNCAHQIADDLQGQVLDGGRELWGESTKQAYLQRIKNQLALSA